MKNIPTDKQLIPGETNTISQKKHWKTWNKAVKITFTTDGVHLHTPLGDWCTQGEPSQRWQTYKDASDDLFVSPTGIHKTWMRHPLVASNKRACLIYNSTGTPATPPERATRISLRSRTEKTLIFGNSFTQEVHLRHPMEPQEEPDNAAMARPIGDDGRFMGDLADLGQALQDGTL